MSKAVLWLLTINSQDLCLARTLLQLHISIRQHYHYVHTNGTGVMCVVNTGVAQLPHRCCGARGLVAVGAAVGTFVRVGMFTVVTVPKGIVYFHLQLWFLGVVVWE